MTPDKGWSIDVQRRRRIGLILPIVLLTTPFAAVNVQAAGYDPASDVNSMASTTDYTGAQAWWAAGYTGQGVDVALIDSGVAPVQGLNSAGKVISGPDLSLESQAANLANLDTFGHGTFMAGLIAGRDATLTAPYEQAPASAYRGMAPDARIVSIKVATADGGTDVSQVIAAIDWVVKHRNDNGMNIRVLNLSYGTNSSQYYAVDPLAYAVEQAWDAGIVVVAAAGNSGYQTRGSSPALADPAYDKRIIAVGASDSMGTTTVTDDTMPDFSAAAKTGSARAPDFVAPGVHIQGLLHARQRDVRIGGHHFGCRRADPQQVPERDAGPGQEDAQGRGIRHADPEQPAGGIGRDAPRAYPHDAAPGLLPGHRPRDGRRIARAGPRLRPSDPGRRRPQG